MLFINNTQRSARYAPTHGSTMRSSSMWATASRPLSTTLSPSCTQMWSQQCASSLTATISSPPPGTVRFLCCTWAPTSTTECGSTTITTMSPSPSRPHWPPSGRTWSHPPPTASSPIEEYQFFVCLFVFDSGLIVPKGSPSSQMDTKSGRGVQFLAPHKTTTKKKKTTNHNQYFWLSCPNTYRTPIAHSHHTHCPGEPVLVPISPSTLCWRAFS